MFGLALLRLYVGKTVVDWDSLQGVFFCAQSFIAIRPINHPFGRICVVISDQFSGFYLSYLLSIV